ncbi:MAG: SPFH domain-containing protein [Nanoarchaeota archaeon]
MGFVQELSDLVTHFIKCYQIVYEYEQGLFIRNGVARERKRKLSPEEEERVNALEKEVLKKQGYLQFLPFRRPEFPEGFRQSPITGLPISDERYSKILSPGIYVFFPVTDMILRESAREKVLNLGNITVPTTDDDSKAMFVSCNLRYELNDLYLAYNEVHDFEASLKDHTLSILAECSRGKSSKDWNNKENLESLEWEVLEVLQSKAKEWGLKIHRIYITDNVPCVVQRLAYDGPPLTLYNK